jgi:glycosyltransferase involved in cell wall biosynthesis
MKRINALINAYACSPNMGSEPGMAWNWCIHLAKYCELHIITEGEFRDKIEASLSILPQAKNMHFYYNPLSEEIRKMCWNQGDWRFYKHYRNWQKSTLEITKEIIAKEKIDIVHQLNMIGFREPGYLWKIEKIPFVWGPLDAKESFPVAYLEGAGLKAKLFIRLKNFLTKLQLRYSGRVRTAIRRASVVVSASSNSQTTLKKYFGIDSPLLNETGCYVKEMPLADTSLKKELDLLWVGKLDFRKQLALAIRSVAAAKNPLLKLHIVGGGDDHIYKRLAADLGVDNQCVWHGVVSHAEVQTIMQQADLFFFTSVAEGTPHVVLEAISNNLPVLCFDTCGQGDSVNDKIGRKIPLTNPVQSVKDFARELNHLYSDREILHKMSENCKERQLELSWDVKSQKMIDLYKSVLKKQ